MRQYTVVYGNKTTEAQSARRTNERRTTILEAIVGLSQVGWKGMLSVSVNSVPLRLIIVAEKLTLAVYENKTTESQSARRTNERRTTILEAIVGLS